jgi:hypothetical protein
MGNPEDREKRNARRRKERSIKNIYKVEKPKLNLTKQPEKNKYPLKARYINVEDYDDDCI